MVINLFAEEIKHMLEKNEANGFKEVFNYELMHVKVRFMDKKMVDAYITHIDVDSYMFKIRYENQLYQFLQTEFYFHKLCATNPEYTEYIMCTVEPNLLAEKSLARERASSSERPLGLYHCVRTKPLKRR